MTAEEVIEQVLSGPEPDYTEPPQEPRDTGREDRQAMYLMRRLRRARDERLRIEQLFTTVADELEERRSEQLEPIVTTIGWLEQSLALWHHRRLQDDNDALTVNLPTGTLISTKAQPRWTYDDAAAFLEWAKANAAEAVRETDPKTEIDKNAAKKVLGALAAIIDHRAVIKDTGEKVPGVRIDPGGDFDLGRFYRAET